jgi:7-cyano-7-deazaguanine synthase|tara:strand:+ start:10106 stop:11479 length:1374 start_codon:yes stop_codon:yes gene_type:complete
MCGIVLCQNIPLQHYKKILKSLSIRGRDGLGYYTKSADGEVINKSLSNPEFLSSLKIKKDAYLLMGNSRAIPTTEYETGGGNAVENQQPFSDNRFVVVHNGIISNDKELIKQYKLKPSSNVDTAILPCLFRKVGVIKGLKCLKGSFAIVCYDKLKKRTYVAKNFMPLMIWKGANKLMVASLQEMFPKEYLNALEVKPYSCLEFNEKSEFVRKYSLYPRKRNKKVLVICSGGIDSVVTAYIYKHYKYQVTLLHFTYGQSAESAELYGVKKIAKNLRCKVIVYDANKVFEGFKSVSKLLTNTKPDKKVQMLDAESTFSYVPNRNAIFAMIAGGIAEMNGIDTVSYGGQQMDSVYPDNNPPFVDGVNNLFKYALNWGTNTNFTSPLIHLIKHEIVAIGNYLKVPFKNTCSCYYPTLKNKEIIHCDECGCCQFRFKSFQMVKDLNLKVNQAWMSKYVKRLL